MSEIAHGRVSAITADRLAVDGVFDGSTRLDLREGRPVVVVPSEEFDHLMSALAGEDRP